MQDWRFSGFAVDVEVGFVQTATLADVIGLQTRWLVEEAGESQRR
jgi:hypothetical protein